MRTLSQDFKMFKFRTEDPVSSSLKDKDKDLIGHKSTFCDIKILWVEKFHEKSCPEGT